MGKETNTNAQAFKQNMQARMQAKPLQFPYIDYSYIAQFPLSTRCLATTNLLTESELKELGLKEDYLPDLVLARWMAAKYAIRIIKEHGLLYDNVSEMTGINKTLIAKMASGARPLSCEAASIVPLCYEVLHRSCHEIMFGEPARIVLPSVYSQMARLFAKQSEDTRKEILRNADELRQRFERLSPTVAGVGLHRDPFEVTRERTQWLAHEWCRDNSDFLGDEKVRRVMDSLRAYFTDDGNYEPRVPFTMFMSKETGIALDYFLAEDFTRYAACFYMDGENAVEIKGRELLRFVSDIISVDHETRVKIVAPLYAAALMG